ncbi:unnamed protein product, partial [Discosporangium mesarthrocarpum]
TPYPQTLTSHSKHHDPPPIPHDTHHQSSRQSRCFSRTKRLNVSISWNIIWWCRFEHCAYTFSGTTARTAAHFARTRENIEVCTNPSAEASKVGKKFWEVKKLKAQDKDEYRAKEMSFRQVRFRVTA